MSRTIKDAATKRCHHGGHDQPRRHPDPFLDARNHACRPKTPNGLIPAQVIRTERDGSPGQGCSTTSQGCRSMAGLNRSAVRAMTSTASEMGARSDRHLGRARPRSERSGFQAPGLHPAAPPSRRDKPTAPPA